MRIRLLTLALTITAMAPAHAATTEEDCAALWASADANGDGTLDANESARYVAALRVAEQPAPDGGVITQARFQEYCGEGYFDVAAAEPGAPFEGANSFTEGQARDRVLAAGYTNVSALVQDDAGIWRGTAETGGKTTNVAVDFKGNVVATDR